MMNAMPRFVKVIALDGYIVAIDNNGGVWLTSNNNVGQLCHSNAILRDVFHKVNMPTLTVNLALGGQHTLLLSNNGAVCGCGWNMYDHFGPRVMDDFVIGLTRIHRDDTTFVDNGEEEKGGMGGYRV
jgi:alpha-tubulin suppressor-like RCC1 family protein